MKKSAKIMLSMAGSALMVAATSAHVKNQALPHYPLLVVIIHQMT